MGAKRPTPIHPPLRRACEPMQERSDSICSEDRQDKLCKRLQVGMHRLGVRQAEGVKRDGASLLRT